MTIAPAPDRERRRSPRSAGAGRDVTDAEDRRAAGHASGPSPAPPRLGTATDGRAEAAGGTAAQRLPEVDPRTTDGARATLRPRGASGDRRGDRPRRLRVGAVVADPGL